MKEESSTKSKNSMKGCEEFMKKGNYGSSAGCGAGGAVYGLGFIGAIIYFISTAESFWMGVLGILKAIVWPAFMVYEAFNALLK